MNVVLAASITTTITKMNMLIMMIIHMIIFTIIAKQFNRGRQYGRLWLSSEMLGVTNEDQFIAAPTE